MAQVIGTVAKLEGTAYARAADGSLRELQLGDAVMQGETLLTGPGAVIEIAVVDAPSIVMSGETELLLSNELLADTRDSADGAAVADATIAAVVSALENGGDILDNLEATAAGGNLRDEGSSFIRLGRIGFNEPEFSTLPGNPNLPTDPPSDSQQDNDLQLLIDDGETPDPSPPPVNQAPLAVDDSYSGEFESAVSGNVFDNDSDPENDALSAAVSSDPSNGSVSLAADGTFVYTPNDGFSGDDSFSYTIVDSAGNSDTATVTINVGEESAPPPVPNQPPQALDDSFNTAFGSSVGGNVLSNDSDPEDDALSIAASTQPANGSLTLNADGSFTYTPNAGFSGTDSFEYTVTDGNGNSDVASVTIVVGEEPTVAPPPPPPAAPVAPVAVADAATLTEDTSATITVLANDSDSDGALIPGSVSIVSGPANGSVVVNANGTVTYTPNADYNGPDSFTYTVSDDDGLVSNTATVSLTVDAANDPPVAINDSYSTPEDTDLVVSDALSLGLLSNDSDLDGDTLTVNTTPVSNVSNGALTLNADGTFTYTPNANFIGTDSFTYEVSDGNGGTAQATVTIDVGAVNDPPVAVNDSYTTTEDTDLVISDALSLGVLANDSDIDGDTLTVNTTPISDVTNGSLTLNADGTFTYEPDADFNGTDSFTYEVSDGNGATAQATVTITVDPANDPPIAINDSYTTTEDTDLVVSDALNLGVLANDSDIDGDTLTVNTTPISDVNNGTLTLNADGTFTYTPDADFNGTDSFTYEVSDGNGATAQAVVTITVDPANDPPIAVNDSYTTAEDTNLVVTDALNLGVLANDNDIDGDTLTVNTTPVSDVSNGTLTLNADGTFTYEPNPDFNGTDTFTYEVSDGNGATAQATVTITVDPANDPPIAVNDSYTTTEDTNLVISDALNLGVLANDNDIDGDTLTVNATPISDVSNGTLTLNADGTFTYEPDADFNGTDSFTYEVSDGNGATAQAVVTITVDPANDPPIAIDDRYTTTEDTELVISDALNLGVLANDNDIDGDTLTVNTTPVSDVSNGTLTLNADGTFTYEPNADFNGTDTFTYEVSDGNGATAQATVTITVDPANDPPIAINDSYTTTEDTELVISDALALGVLVNDNDIDGDTLTVNTTPISDVSNGTLTLNGDGTFTYTPDADFNGTDSFTYEVSDGNGATAQAVVTITVDPANDPPIAVNDSYTTTEDTQLVISDALALGVLANDNDIDGDTLTVNTTPISDVSNGTLTLNADGTFTYEPDADFNGTDTFTYEVSDGNGATAQATVTITVDPANDPPVAVNDSYATTEDTDLVVSDALNLGVLANDNDIDGDSLTVNTTPISNVANGTLTLNADGTFTYEPDADFNGTDTFTYEVSDGNGATAQAIVTITVDAANDPPIAINDSYTTTEDTELVISDALALGVLANDNDIDGDTLTVNTTPISDVSNGTLTLNADGTFTYEPNADFNGTDSFTYEVSDGNGAIARATVTITVDPANDPPIAINDSYTTTEDTELVISDALALGVLANDSDIDGDTLTINTTPINDVSNGTLTLNADGTFTYEPDADFNGTDTFIYEVSDGNGATAQAVVTITVDPANDPPIAIDDRYTTTEDTNLVISDALNLGVLANDNDIDGDTLTVNTTPISDVSNGTLTLNADGTFTYEPDADFNGTDTFTYEVSDGNGATAQAIVTITVDPANDPPIAVNDSYTTAEDTNLVVTDALNLGVLANDNDIDGDSLTVNTTPVSDVSNGTLTLNADGTFTYEPNADFNGTDTFTYEVSDGNGATAQAVVTITVDPANDPPIAVNDSYTTPEDTDLVISDALNLGVLANDNDIDGDTLTVNTTPVSDVSNGTLTLNADGTFTYEPDADFNGTDSFTYEVSDGNGATAQAIVTITVDAANDPPIAINDSYTTTEDTELVISDALALGVLANDDDIDGDTLTVNTTPVVGVSNGSLILNGDGTFTYTPNSGFFGTDSFTYEVSDGNGGTAQATASITVEAGNIPPRAMNDADSLTLGSETSTSGNVLNNDSDPDSGPAAIGVVAPGSINGQYGTLDLAGDGSYTYNIDQDKVDAALLGPADGLVAYWKFDEANGRTVRDEAPTGSPTTVNLRGNTLTDGVIGNAVQFDGSARATMPDSREINTGTFPERSISLHFNADTVSGRQVIYEEGGGVRGLNIYIEDGELFLGGWNRSESGWSGDWISLGTVNVGEWNHVALVLDGGPTVQPGALTAYLNGVDAGSTQGSQIWPHSGDINIGGSDGNSRYDGAEQSSAQNLFSGRVDDVRVYNSVLSPDDVAELAAQDGTLTEIFDYQISDGEDASNVAQLEITLQSDVPLDAQPVAVDDAVATDEGVPLTGFSVLGNDTLADNAAISGFDAATTGGGVVTQNADGTFNYTPAEGFSGEDSFSYTLTDQDGDSSTATVTVTVAAGNSTPTSTALPVQVREDGEDVILDVSDSFSDPDGDTLTFSASNLPDGLSIDPNTGVITGTVNADASQQNGGVYSAVITATDPSGAFTDETFEWTVTNPAPDFINETSGVDDDSYSFAASEDAPQGSVIGTAPAQDPDGDTLSYSITGGNDAGLFAIDSATGEITLAQPLTGAAGEYVLNLATSDGQGGEDSATVTISVGAGNTPPISTALAAQDREDGDVVSLNLADSFSDPDGDTLTFSASNLPAGLSIDPATGEITGTINADASQLNGGVYSVVIRATDPSGAFTEQTFDWTVTNPAPDFINETSGVDDDSYSFSASEGSAQGGVVGAAPATDPDGDTLSYSITGGNDAGLFAIGEATGEITLAQPLTGAAGEYVLNVATSDGQGGNDSATVTISVGDVDSPPTANDDSYTVNEDATLNVSGSSEGVLFNDIDAEGPLTVSGLISDTSNGNLTLNEDGTFTYTPNPNFVGTDGFTYEVTDSSGQTSQASVSITVAPVNDAPVAVDDTLSTNEGETIVISTASILGNDTDVDSGDTFETITVTTLPDATVGQLLLGTDPVLAGDVISVADIDSGLLSFRPADDNNSGAANFTYTVSDGELNSNPATVTINVVPVADQPQVQFPSAAVVVTQEATPVVRQIGAIVGDEAGDGNIEGSPGVSYRDGTEETLDFGTIFGGTVVDVTFDVTVEGSWNFDGGQNANNGSGANVYDDFWEVQVGGEARARFFYNANITEDGDPGAPRGAEDSSNALADGANYSYGTPQSSENSSFNYNHTTPVVQVALDEFGVATLQFAGSTTQTNEIATINSATVLLTTYTYEIPIFAELADLDGSETLSVTLSGVPTGDAFDGISLDNGYTLTETEPGTYLIEGNTTTLDATLTLTMLAPQGVSPVFDLRIDATATDGDDSTTNSVMVSIDGTEVTGNIAPIALDLDQDGVEYLSLDAGVQFSDAASGETINTAWVDQDDGLLVIDANASGTVDEKSEYVFTEWSETAETDMEAVAEVFDTNQDGVLDAQDERFGEFGVWQDRNSDGVTDEGELQSLGELGIDSIALNYSDDSESGLRADGDVVVHGQSEVTWTDGSVSQADDASFTIAASDLLESNDNVPLPEATESSDVDTVASAAPADEDEARGGRAGNPGDADIAALEMDLLLNRNSDDENPSGNVD